MTPEEYRNIISDSDQQRGRGLLRSTRPVSEKVKDANLKSLFRELAGEEKSHREYLQKLLSNGYGTSLGFSTTKDYKVGDSIPTPPLTPDMKPVDGLVVAIKKELAAMQMYTAPRERVRRARSRSSSPSSPRWNAATRPGSRTST